MGEYCKWKVNLTIGPREVIANKIPQWNPIHLVIKRSHNQIMGLINCGRLNQINNLFLLTEINKARAHVVGVPGFPPQLASPQGRSKIHIKRLQLPHATEPFVLLIPKDNVECRQSSYLLL